MESLEVRWMKAVLYKALLEGDDVKAFEICLVLQGDPLNKLTIHGDTVLHITSYQKRNKLVLKLLGLLPEDQPDILTVQNEAGETILHATATNNKIVEAAAEMLRRSPSLLTMRDGLGETPLFRAARYGKTTSFYFFYDEASRRFPEEAYRRAFPERDDKATILHAAIQSDNFHLAYYVAVTYKMLIGAKDGDGMTGLQLLACKPSVFHHGFDENFFKLFIYKVIDWKPKERFSRVPIQKKLQKQKLKSESAKKLADLLIKNDTSWEETEPMPNKNRINLHKYGGGNINVHADDYINLTPDSSLILATKSGCTEILKGILQLYAPAVEHIDKDGHNILHVAILYRRMEIFKAVINMKYLTMRLRGGIDKKGNSLLHMVGQKATDLIGEVDIRSPPLVLPR